MNPDLTFDPITKRVTIKNAKSFPDEIFAFSDAMEILDCSDGHITSLPEKIAELKHLRVAFFAHQDFEEIPQALSQCERLEMVGFKSCKITSIPENALPKHIRGIILTDNRLTSLPVSIGKYTKLQKLMLSGNQITHLPGELLNCTNLQLLRLSMNIIQKSPDQILSLPNLGWYSDAGNPFHTQDRKHIQRFREISWSEISIGEQIGKSANNEVYKGTLHNGNHVAVKMFGRGITSDGLPIDDMNASLLAGNHPNIIGGYAKVVDAPENREGFIMPLIDATYNKLGNPPDLQTLTRDVYPDKQFSTAFISTVLKDIARALKHCHEKGIMHGDLYAHNILSNVEGKSILGDFGAASLYDPHSKGGKLREQVDVKGFGYLVEDLLEQANGEIDEQLQMIKNKCLDNMPSNRPSFIDIEELIG